MNPIDDLPQRDNAHDIAEAAETAFKVSIDAGNLFLVQQQDRKDYGTDVQIEAREGKAVTNIRAHVQLKGTKSTINNNGSISVSVARRNLNYLLVQADSLYVCFHLPSECLYVRYTEDVYREYEHRGSDWYLQETVTINFTQKFDIPFQQHLHARLLASMKSSRNRRLKWIGTPPEKIPSLVKNLNEHIEVPVNPMQAKEVLTELYRAEKYSVISNYFKQFANVLDSLPGAMDLAYLAEINKGINGEPFDKDVVRQSTKVLLEMLQRGDTQPGSIHYSVGNAWLVLEEYEKARDTYQIALTQIDTTELANLAAQCCHNLGSALKAIGEQEEAISFYKKALELNTDLGEAHLALALWYRKEGGSSNLALSHLDQVIQGKDSALQMNVVQGWRIDLLFDKRDIIGAFREINSLLGQARQHEWIWPWCAKHVAQYGRRTAEAAKKSLAFWRLFLKENPNDVDGERERLLCLWFLHSENQPTEINFEGFEIAIRKLIDCGDTNPAFLWDRLGHWAQHDNNWTKAEWAYRKAYKLEPERYGYCLGASLNFLNQHEEALSILLPQAEKYMPDALSWFQVGVACDGINDINGSILAYKKAIELDINYDLAWFNLGGMYWNSQDTEQATEIWHEAVRRFPDHELTRKLYQNLPFLFDESCDM